MSKNDDDDGWQMLLVAVSDLCAIADIAWEDVDALRTAFGVVVIQRTADAASVAVSGSRPRMCATLFASIACSSGTSSKERIKTIVEPGFQEPNSRKFPAAASFGCRQRSWLPNTNLGNSTVNFTLTPKTRWTRGGLQLGGFSRAVSVSSAISSEEGGATNI